MPVIANNPWYDAASVGQGIGGGISQALVQAPKTRAEAQLLQQQILRQRQEMATQQQLLPYQKNTMQSAALKNTAMGGMYDAKAKLAQAQAGEISTQDQAHLALGKTGGDFVFQAMKTGQVTPEAAQAFAQSLAMVGKADPNLMKNLLQEISMGASGVGKNPSLAAAALTGAKVPMTQNVPQGGTAVRPMTGEVVATGAQKLGPGQVVTAPQQGGEGTMDAPVMAQSPYPPAGGQDKGGLDIALLNYLGKSGLDAGTNLSEVASNVAAARKGMAGAGLGQPVQTGQGQVPSIQGPDDYAKLPSGAKYMWNGKLFIKGQGAVQ